MFDIEMKIDDGGLLCPVCGCNNLHQEEVVVMFRDSEDSDGNKTICSPRRTFVIRETDGHIPGRRDVLQIRFSCEGCGGDTVPFKLNIMQHKGTTYCGWSA